MASSDRITILPARQRLLDAAARVFAQMGLEGATTREIARQAEVNEVTLFRLFQSKEKLLGAVLQRAFDPSEKTTGCRPPAASPGDNGETIPLHGLRANLQTFARCYEELLRRNILLIRTLLGEIHRHHEHEFSVLHGIFAPLKADLLGDIQAARNRGEVRPDVDPVIAADLFSSMIFVDVLRRAGHLKPEYPADQYLRQMVEVFARGIEQ